MTYTKKIICLANSTKKYPSRCIAGKELVETGSGSWIRPVTDNAESEGAIPLPMTVCVDGTSLRILDIVEIPLSAHIPNKCQTENYLVAQGKWKKHGRVVWSDLAALVDQAPDLWGTGNHTRNGVNDAIPTFKAVNFQDSLRLIQPEDFHIVVREEQVFGESRVKKAMRGTFTYCGVKYVLKVTDPWATDSIGKCEVDRPYPVGEGAYVAVSVSDVFANNHYKLIAGIITPARTT